MDYKDNFDDILQEGSDPQSGKSRTDYAPSLKPGYRAVEKPTTDPPRERSLDIDSILADIRKMTYSDKQVPKSESRPTVDKPSESEPDDKQVMREMLSAMRELTDEVKQLRAQLEAKPYDATDYPSERPPGILKDAADIPRRETSETHFSEKMLEDYGKSDSEAKSVIAVEPKEQTEKKKTTKVLSVVSSILFYVIVFSMVLGAFLMRSTDEGRPFMLAGFSAANILTSSMSDVYPRGCLIITKSVDAKELKVGDDITYMVSEESSITHRIIGITENYQGTGERAFETQGTMNPNPDKELVAAANVVGKVIFHSKQLGDFANFVKSNWIFLLFIIVVLIGLISFLKWNAKRSEDEEEDQKTTDNNRKPHAKKAKQTTRKENQK